MGRKVSLVSDDKAVDVEQEKVLKFKDGYSNSVENVSVWRTKKPGFHYSKESLPSLKDGIKLLLFSTVTVIGMTFISQIMPNIGWNNVGDTHTAPYLYCS